MIGWRTTKLEDVANVLGGGTPSRQEHSYFGGAIPWATPTDVTALDGLYISKAKESITDEGLRNSSTKLLPAGAVLLTSRATIGFTAVAEVPICTNQGFVNFVCGPDLVPEFLAYWLRTQKAKLIQHAGGTTFKEIARGIVRKFEIAFPALPEQSRIVDLLTRAEGIVRLRREAERCAAGLIPALFIDLFGDPATNPKGWRQSSLNESGAAIRYGIGQPLPQIEGGLPFLRATNVKRGVISRTGLVFIDPNANPMKRNPPLKYSDILVVRSGAYTGDIAQVGREFDGAIAGYDLVLSPGNEHLSEFLATYLLLPHVQNGYMAAHKIRAAQPHLNSTQLGNIVVPVPPLNKQSEFVENVNSIRSIQSQQSAATAKAQAAFNALLARCFVQPATV